MKISDKEQSAFEEQLMQSAHRLRDEQNYQLPLRPLRRKRFAWGWISTAAAAVVGWVVGISFPLAPSLPRTDIAAVVKTDTVVRYEEKLVRDTVVKEVKVPVRVEVPVRKEPTVLGTSTAGCNVECDGIDYEKLIGM